MSEVPLFPGDCVSFCCFFLPVQNPGNKSWAQIQCFAGFNLGVKLVCFTCESVKHKHLIFSSFGCQLIQHCHSPRLFVSLTRPFSQLRTNFSSCFFLFFGSRLCRTEPDSFGFFRPKFPAKFTNNPGTFDQKFSKIAKLFWSRKPTDSVGDEPVSLPGVLVEVYGLKVFFDVESTDVL